MNYNYSNPPQNQASATIAMPQPDTAMIMRRWAMNFGVAAVLVAGVSGIIYTVKPDIQPEPEPTDTKKQIMISDYLPTPTPSDVGIVRWTALEPTPIAYGASESCDLLFDGIRLNRQYGQSTVGWDSTPESARQDIAKSCGWGMMP